MIQIQETLRAAGQTLLLILSFWGYFFLVYRFGRVKEWFVPVVCMTGIGLALFWGGLAGDVSLAANMVLAGGLAGFVVFFIFCIRRKVRLPGRNLCRSCFIVGAAAFGILSLNLEMLHYDNFSHWAVIVKYLLSADRLPDADTVLVAFRNYPPGSSLFIYYVCRLAGHSRGMMLLAQNSMIFACFYAVFGIVKENRRFLLYSVLGTGCALLSYLNLTIRINNLLVDFLMPLLAMASVAVSYRCRDEKGKLCLLQILLLGFTVTVKSTGVYFAGTAAIYMSPAGIAGALLALPALLYAADVLFLRAVGKYVHSRPVPELSIAAVRNRSAAIVICAAIGKKADIDSAYSALLTIAAANPNEIFSYGLLFDCINDGYPPGNAAEDLKSMNVDKRTFILLRRSAKDRKRGALAGMFLVSFYKNGKIGKNKKAVRAALLQEAREAELKEKVWEAYLNGQDDHIH